MSISSVVITKNEASNIGRCLDSIVSFSDEIILVDDFSNDETLEIARLYDQVRIYTHRFKNYIDQKNYANSLATKEYIFSIDADECCDEAMQKYMIQLPKDTEACSFNRINYYFGKAIKHGIRGKETKIRLWPSGKAKWTGSTPHEHIELEDDTTLSHIDVNIHHLAHSTFWGAFSKSIRYSELAAIELSKKSYLTLFLSLAINPVVKFIKDYVFKMGFLDGVDGLVLGILSFVETSVKYFEALRIKMSLRTT